MGQVDNAIREVNKKLQDMITKERFIDRVSELVKEGMVEIVDCEEDGTPIINITKKGMSAFMNELGDA